VCDDCGGVVIDGGEKTGKHAIGRLYYPYLPPHWNLPAKQVVDIVENKNVTAEPQHSIVVNEGKKV